MEWCTIFSRPFAVFMPILNLFNKITASCETPKKAKRPVLQTTLSQYLLNRRSGSKNMLTFVKHVTNRHADEYWLMIRELRDKEKWVKGSINITDSLYVYSGLVVITKFSPLIVGSSFTVTCCGFEGIFQRTHFGISLIKAEIRLKETRSEKITCNVSTLCAARR